MNMKKPRFTDAARFPSGRYVPASRTDIRKTFARAARGASHGAPKHNRDGDYLEFFIDALARVIAGEDGAWAHARALLDEYHETHAR